MKTVLLEDLIEQVRTATSHVQDLVGKPDTPDTRDELQMLLLGVSPDIKWTIQHKDGCTVLTPYVILDD